MDPDAIDRVVSRMTLRRALGIDQHNPDSANNVASHQDLAGCYRGVFIWDIFQIAGGRQE